MRNWLPIFCVQRTAANGWNGSSTEILPQISRLAASARLGVGRKFSWSLAQNGHERPFSGGSIDLHRQHRRIDLAKELIVGPMRLGKRIDPLRGINFTCQSKVRRYNENCFEIRLIRHMAGPLVWPEPPILRVCTRIESVELRGISPEWSKRNRCTRYGDIARINSVDQFNQLRDREFYEHALEIRWATPNSIQRSLVRRLNSRLIEAILE